MTCLKTYAFLYLSFTEQWKIGLRNTAEQKEKIKFRLNIEITQYLF